MTTLDPKDYEIALLKARNAQLHHTVRTLIDQLRASWERRDLAPDSDLEAISAAKTVLNNGTVTKDQDLYLRYLDGLDRQRRAERRLLTVLTVATAVLALASLYIVGATP